MGCRQEQRPREPMVVGQDLLLHRLLAARLGVPAVEAAPRVLRPLLGVDCRVQVHDEGEGVEGEDEGDDPPKT